MTVYCAMILLLIFMPELAFGYVDPSSIQMVLQTLLAAGIGALFFFGKIVSYMKSLFKKKQPPDIQIGSKTDSERHVASGR